jgi:hypothetical protein
MYKFTHNTSISIGLFITLTAVIFGSGVVYTRVDFALQQITEVKQQIAELGVKVDNIAAKRLTTSAGSTKVISNP